jgi:hypothetical protein
MLIRRSHPGAVQCLLAWSLPALLACAAACSPQPLLPAPDGGSPDLTPTPTPTPDAVPGPDATAGGDAPGAPACADFRGFYQLTVTCGQNAQPAFIGTSCIEQTACDITVPFGFGEGSGSVTGDSATFSVAVPGPTPGAIGTATCTVALSGDAVSGQCQVPMGTSTATCNAVGTRARVAGTTRLCCDVDAQDCGGGQRCGVVSATVLPPPGIQGPPSMPVSVTACMPAGTLAYGEVCTPDAAGSVGADQCGAGLICSTGGACQHFCATAADCASGEHCAGPIATNPSAVGVCNSSCTYLGHDCSADTTCRVEGALTDMGQQPADACQANGSGAAGDSCSVATDCGADLTCGLDYLQQATMGPPPGPGGPAPAPPATTCRPLCDDAHPCADDRPCYPAFNAPLPGGPMSLPSSGFCGDLPCNTVQQSPDGAAVTPTMIVGTGPTGQGGTIVAGQYHLTAQIYYVSDNVTVGSVPITKTQVWTDSSIQEVSDQPNPFGIPLTHVNYTYTATADGTLTRAPTCGPGASGMNVTYDATPTTITVYSSVPTPPGPGPSHALTIVEVYTLD